MLFMFFIAITFSRFECSASFQSSIILPINDFAISFPLPLSEVPLAERVVKHPTLGTFRVFCVFRGSPFSDAWEIFTGVLRQEISLSRRRVLPASFARATHIVKPNEAGSTRLR